MIFNPPFSGGVHPKTYKFLTKDKPIATDFWPRNVYLSLQLRNGSVLEPLVQVGDKVRRGEKIAVGRSELVAPVHAPVNGVVTSITRHVTSHPSKMKSNTIIIRANQDRSWCTETVKGNFYHLEPEIIIQKVQDSGIVGLGGAGFPTATKLKSARDKGVKTLVINGGECEPYLTCDDLTMRTYTSEIIAGIRLMLRAVNAEEAIIGVEDNKAKAMELLISAASEDDNIKVKPVPSIYPMGSERHLIKAATGVTVPSGQLSTEVGVLVNNIATAQAVYHAVRFNRPLVSRVITISGKGINNPQNVEVPLGTPVREILEFCGGFTQETERLIFGGPMMGHVITSPDIPVDKCVGGILALTHDELKNPEQQECIRCGKCVQACPMGLMPFLIASFTRIADFNKADELGVQHCLSCGACSYSCPSSIPLVQYFQHAKGAIRASEMKENRMAIAKELSQARALRLAKEAETKKAAKAAKAAARRKKRPARSSAEKNEQAVEESAND